MMPSALKASSTPLNTISRDTMIVNNPDAFLKFLKNGTYEVILKVQSGKGGQEFFIPKIRDTTQDKVVSIRKVFPLGCQLQEMVYEDKLYSEVIGASESFTETWKSIGIYFFDELLRQKERTLKEGEIPSIVGNDAKARILAGGEDKLRESYGEKFLADCQCICYTLNMVWFREAKKTKEGVMEESKMGLQSILAYPSGGISKPFSGTKRKVPKLTAESDALAPGIYPAGTCMEEKISGEEES
jgi:hypothetical protein